MTIKRVKRLRARVAHIFLRGLEVAGVFGRSGTTRHRKSRNVRAQSDFQMAIKIARAALLAIHCTDESPDVVDQPQIAAKLFRGLGEFLFRSKLLGASETVSRQIDRPPDAR